MTTQASRLTDGIKVDELADTIELFGVTYTLGLFRMLGVGGLAVGAHLEIMARGDGQVYLRRHWPDITPSAPAP